MKATPTPTPADSRTAVVSTRAGVLGADPSTSARLIEVDTVPGRLPLIPGALGLTLADFGGVEGPATGRLPLPAHTDFTARLCAQGIGPDTRVFLYPREPAQLSAAARGWLTLRWAGVTDVRVFAEESGEELVPFAAELAAWFARASEHFGEHSADRETHFVARPELVADHARVASRERETVLTDARAPRAYGGEGEHIPGAVNFPSAALLDDDASRQGLLGRDEMIEQAYREHLGAAPGEQELLLSCGSGVAASLQALALAAVGVHAPVYVGSFSEWQKVHP